MLSEYQKSLRELGQKSVMEQLKSPKDLSLKEIEELYENYRFFFLLDWDKHFGN